ncbi:MAG: carbon storage regulator [Candidatus Puniceispirillum sp.]|nr:carbon storage regulator [Candidatus Puniceispirillum sp.]MCA0370800.1 carbon storage regulator CsrA [Pseudomonadota bacterium]
MLYLTRKIGECVVINDDIRVTLVELKGKAAKLLFEYPQGTVVLRQEVYERICDENKKALASASFVRESLL